MTSDLNPLRYASQPDAEGRFGPYGGKFVSETLMAALAELEAMCIIMFLVQFSATSTSPMKILVIQNGSVNLTRTWRITSVARRRCISHVAGPRKPGAPEFTSSGKT